jgi:hypothetical protein
MPRIVRLPPPPPYFFLAALDSRNAILPVVCRNNLLSDGIKALVAGLILDARREPPIRRVRRTGHAALRPALQLCSLADPESRRGRRPGPGNLLQKALRRFSSFQLGTNFRAWMYRILRHMFLTLRTGLLRRFLLTWRRAKPTWQSKAKLLKRF